MQRLTVASKIFAVEADTGKAVLFCQLLTIYVDLELFSQLTSLFKFEVCLAFKYSYIK